MIEIFQEYLLKNKYDKFDVKAVLFDMDGVLYDSMKYHSKSWYDTMNEEEINSTPEEFYLHEGRVGSNTIDLIMRRERGRAATDEEKEHIYKRKTELFSKYNKGDTIPYAYDMLKAVRTANLDCILVTGSGQPTLLNKLAENFPGIFKQDKMVTAFDVKEGKPNPEPYLKGLQKGGNLLPNQAIVIENAPMGIEASVSAGIFTIAINTGPLDDKILWSAGANIVLPDMKALLDNWNRYYKMYLGL